MFAASLITLALAGFVAMLLARPYLNKLVDKVIMRLMKDPYRENLWELAIGMTRIPPHILMDLEQRAEKGSLVERPLGSVVRITDLTGVAFNPAQIVRPALGPDEPVDATVTLGPRAMQPLQLNTPIIVSAIGYGISISKPFAMALAQGASEAGAAFNAGSGPVLPEVLERANPIILQYTGNPWNQDIAKLVQADAIEIRLGHGARAALGRRLPTHTLPDEARRLMGISDDEESIEIFSSLTEMNSPEQLQQLVTLLKSLIGSKPVGFKIVATNDIERELDILIQAGADFVAIDGCEGGTYSSPPIVADDFGMSSFYVLQRAVTYLENNQLKDSISIIVGGGLRTPGEMLKALAFGADAVYIGSTAMMGTTHSQMDKAIPFEPIPHFIWSDSPRVEDFDIDLGAKTLANLIRASTEEMKEAARALGKSSLRSIDRSDLFARTPEAARLFNLPEGWLPAVHESWTASREHEFTY